MHTKDGSAWRLNYERIFTTSCSAAISCILPIIIITFICRFFNIQQNAALYDIIGIVCIILFILFIIFGFVMILAVLMDLIRINRIIKSS